MNKACIIFISSFNNFHFTFPLILTYKEQNTTKLIHIIFTHVFAWWTFDSKGNELANDLKIGFAHFLLLLQKGFYQLILTYRAASWHDFDVIMLFKLTFVLLLVFDTSLVFFGHLVWYIEIHSYGQTVIIYSPHR